MRIGSPVLLFKALTLFRFKRRWLIKVSALYRSQKEVSRDALLFRYAHPIHTSHPPNNYKENRPQSQTQRAVSERSGVRRAPPGGAPLGPGHTPATGALLLRVSEAQQADDIVIPGGPDPTDQELAVARVEGRVRAGPRIGRLHVLAVSDRMIRGLPLLRLEDLVDALDLGRLRGGEPPRVRALERAVDQAAQEAESVHAARERGLGEGALHLGEPCLVQVLGVPAHLVRPERKRHHGVASSQRVDFSEYNADCFIF